MDEDIVETEDQYIDDLLKSDEEGEGQESEGNKLDSVWNLSPAESPMNKEESKEGFSADILSSSSFNPTDQDIQTENKKDFSKKLKSGSKKSNTGSHVRR